MSQPAQRNPARPAGGGVLMTKWSTKPDDHKAARVRNNQRRHRERVKCHIAELEHRLEETERELRRALATIERLTAELENVRDSAGDRSQGSPGCRGAQAGDDHVASDHRRSSVYSSSPSPGPSPEPAATGLLSPGTDKQGMVAQSLHIRRRDYTGPSRPGVSTEGGERDEVDNGNGRGEERRCSPTTQCPRAQPAPPQSASPSSYSPLSHAKDPTPTGCGAPALGILPGGDVSLKDKEEDEEEKRCRDMPPPAPAESTTRCRDAYGIIAVQNYADVEDTVIRRWLQPGFRGPLAEGDGCRVDNRLLFGLLDYISSSRF